MQLPPKSRCLGVFGLSANTTEDKIRDIFSKYGKIRRINVIFDTKVYVVSQYLQNVYSAVEFSYNQMIFFFCFRRDDLVDFVSCTSNIWMMPEMQRSLALEWKLIIAESVLIIRLQVDRMSQRPEYTKDAAHVKLNHIEDDDLHLIHQNHHTNADAP